MIPRIPPKQVWGFDSWTVDLSRWSLILEIILKWTMHKPLHWSSHKNLKLVGYTTKNSHWHGKSTTKKITWSSPKLGSSTTSNDFLKFLLIIELECFSKTLQTVQIFTAHELSTPGFSDWNRKGQRTISCQLIWRSFYNQSPVSCQKSCGFKPCDLVKTAHCTTVHMISGISSIQWAELCQRSFSQLMAAQNSLTKAECRDQSNFSRLPTPRPLETAESTKSIASADQDSPSITVEWILFPHFQLVTFKSTLNQ